jgi:hypothetical protein
MCCLKAKIDPRLELRRAAHYVLFTSRNRPKVITEKDCPLCAPFSRNRPKVRTEEGCSLCALFSRNRPKVRTEKGCSFVLISAEIDPKL